MRRRGKIVAAMAAVSAGILLVGNSPAGAARAPGYASKPLRIKRASEAILTTRGSYCPKDFPCPAPIPVNGRQLAARTGQLITVVTNHPARRVNLLLLRSKPNRISEVGQAAFEAVGRRHRHWHFRLGRHHLNANWLEVIADYRRGASTYFVRLKLS